MAPLETVAKNWHITYKYGFLKMNDFEKLYLKVSCQSKNPLRRIIWKQEKSSITILILIIDFQITDCGREPGKRDFSQAAGQEINTVQVNSIL